MFYAHVVKETLRAVYAAGDETARRDALDEFHEAAAAADSPERTPLAKTIRRRETEVLAYYRSDGLSNARPEGSTHS